MRAAILGGAARRIDLRAQRDRLVASPRFRRWAAAFPFTRPIAPGISHQKFCRHSLLARRDVMLDPS